MSGKGSNRRPQQVPDKHMKDEWERLFPKKDKNCFHDNLAARLAAGFLPDVRPYKDDQNRLHVNINGIRVKIE